jgi:hypothetical protein
MSEPPGLRCSTQSDDERDPFRATDASATAQELAAIRAAVKSGTSARQVAIAVGHSPGRAQDRQALPRADRLSDRSPESRLVQVGEERRVEITIRASGQRREDRREQIVGPIEMSVALVLLDRPANAERTAVLIQVATWAPELGRGERIGYCRG